MAFTTDSDHVDFAAFIAAPRPKTLSNFRMPAPNVAFSIDVCTWFMHKMSLEGFPRISKELVRQVQQDGYAQAAAAFALPVDGLRKVGLALLHEVRCTVATFWGGC